MITASTKDYFSHFYEMTGETKSHKAAYLATEERYLKKFGVKKYSSYYSFKNAKRTYLKKLRDGERTKK